MERYVNNGWERIKVGGIFLIGERGLKIIVDTIA
jgi:hypothetical protein